MIYSLFYRFWKWWLNGRKFFLWKFLHQNTCLTSNQTCSTSIEASSLVSKTADEIGLQISKVHFWTNWNFSQTLRIFKIRSKRRNGKIIRKNWIDNASGMYFNNFFLDFFYISFTQIIYYFFFLFHCRSKFGFKTED